MWPDEDYDWIDHIVHLVVGLMIALCFFCLMYGFMGGR